MGFYQTGAVSPLRDRPVALRPVPPERVRPERQLSVSGQRLLQIPGGEV